jgi:hypothetical protein
MVWDKGTAVAKPTSTGKTEPTPAPSPSPSKAVFKAKIPISLPISQNGSITFANILDHISEIPQVAYQNVEKTVAANSPVAVETSIYVGPTTVIDVVGGTDRVKEVVARVAQLWSGFVQSPRYAIYIYNAADEPATEAKFLEDYKARNYDTSDPEFTAGPIRALAGNCQQTVMPGVFSGNVTRCGGANSGSYVNSNDSYLQLGQTGDNSRPYFAEGGIVGHEYAHAVQSAQWIGQTNCHNAAGGGCFRSGMANNGFSPCWLFEGLPNSVGPMVASRSYAIYQSYRKDLPYSQGPSTETDYSESSLLDYLYNQKPSTCYQNMGIYRLGYAVGAVTTEALVAIGGPQAVLAIYSLGAEGQDFPTAFKNVYGMSWDDASKILAKVLAAEYATYGPPPK